MKLATPQSAQLLPEVRHMLERSIGEHGKFTYFESALDGTSFLPVYEERKEHRKPSILSLDSSKARERKMQLYRAQKALNLRDSLVGSLASNPFDFDSMAKLARKLAKQAPKGGWPADAMSWSRRSGVSDSKLRDMLVLAQKRIEDLLSAPQGTYPTMSTAVRDVLGMLKTGLENPVAPPASVKAPMSAHDQAIQQQRLAQLQREEQVWMNVFRSFSKRDPALGDEMGYEPAHDAKQRLTVLWREMVRLEGVPESELMWVADPLPTWDLPTVDETLRVMKKRLAVEQLQYLGARHTSPAQRLMAQIEKFEAIRSQLWVAGTGANTSLTSQSQAPTLPLGLGAQSENGSDVRRVLEDLNRQLAAEANELLQLAKGVGRHSLAHYCAADAKMDVLLDEIAQVERRLAQAGREGLDGRTSTTTTSTVPITTTTTTTSSVPTGVATSTTAINPSTPRNT